jgi:hypothetical protein
MAASSLIVMAALAGANVLSPGGYLCTAQQTASIGSTHLDGARAPHSSDSSDAYRFRILVSAEGDRLRVVEAPYDGPDRSRYEWEDANSTLHTAYVGDGREFTAVGAPGFLTVGPNRWGEGIQFYHAGFQYAGGEDESLGIRWGTCEPE